MATAVKMGGKRAAPVSVNNNPAEALGVLRGA